MDEWTLSARWAVLFGLIGGPCTIGVPSVSRAVAIVVLMGMTGAVIGLMLHMRRTL